MEATKELTNLKVEMIPIAEIEPDSDQPRTTMEEIEEMAESIKSVGRVMQPIAVQRIGNKYKLIFGERRYRGTLLLGLKEIPAFVYDVTPEEAKVMQLVENLQREDLHPMQQAQGFFQLTNLKNYSIEEISLRVGKTKYFVRQQLKLNDLTREWKAIFLKNGIPLTIALQICLLTKEAQQHLYDNEVSEEMEKSDKPVISINTYLIDKYKGKLNSACFDIKDPELDKKAGACTSCPFNTACASLFTEHEENPSCNNIACFQSKTNLHINRELDKIKDDPTTIVGYDSYAIPEDVQILQDAGLELQRVGYGEEYQFVSKPEKPDWQEFHDYRKERKMPVKQIKEEFVKTENTYNFKKEVFEKNLSTGKYKKVFIVSSNNEDRLGQYCYVEHVPKTTGRQTKKVITPGQSGIDDINAEIERIESREKRAVELDDEKVQRKIADAVKTDKTLGKLPVKPSSIDKVLTNFLLLEFISYSQKSEVQKNLKLPALSEFTSLDKFKSCLQSLNPRQITYILRVIIAEKYSTSLPHNRGGYAFRLMAESLGTIPIADLEKQQKEQAEKRKVNVNKSLGLLKEMKKEVTKKGHSKKQSKATSDAEATIA